MKHPIFITTPEISKRMANIHLKGGKAECLLAKALRNKGYRYRLNYKKLPGSPDIAILKYKIAIFVDGEFWHGYNWTNRKQKLKTNRKYWIEKIEENIARDKKSDAILKAIGWIPIHFWEKQINNNLNECISNINIIKINSI
jgi:DNA mismatch endonuclease (patch repair protein)